VNPPPKLPVWQAFERVRADARKTTQYDKGAWETLQSEILALIYPRQKVEPPRQPKSPDPHEPLEGYVFPIKM